MMSGTELSAPSFLANFLSSKSTVDSIPQRVANSSLLLGDDTWEKLYGFSKTVPCSSFDVADFDSCDRAVTDHIFDGLSRNYSFIVGHMLGLDHIGHTYASTRVWRIDDKLDEMEDFLEKLIEAID